MPEFHIASERLVNDGDQLDARPGRHRRPETPGAYARAVPVLMYLAAVLAALVTIAGMLLLAAAVAGHLR